MKLNIMFKNSLIIVLFCVASFLTFTKTSFASSQINVGVVIGNKSYEQEIPEVSYAKRDAKAFQAFLIDVLGYDEDKIIYLENATLAELNSVFGTQSSYEGRLYNEIVKGKSEVTVFYSGHGFSSPKTKESYIIPYDGNPNYINVSGYKLNQLYENLKKIDAKSVNIYIDSCFSGQSAAGEIIKSASPVFITPKLPKTPENINVITASRNDEIASWDNKNKHGLFTFYALEGLYGKADNNNNGKITIRELKEYLDENVTPTARKKYNREQHVSIQTDNNDKILSQFNKDLPPIRAYIKDENSDYELEGKKLRTGNKNSFIIRNVHIKPASYKYKTYADITNKIKDFFSFEMSTNVIENKNAQDVVLIYPTTTKITNKTYKNYALFAGEMMSEIFNKGVLYKKGKSPKYIKSKVEVEIKAKQGKKEIIKTANYIETGKIQNKLGVQKQAMTEAFYKAIEKLEPYLEKTKDDF